MKKHNINKNFIAVIILCIIILILSIIWFFLSNGIGRNSEMSMKTAKIYQNGKEIYSISLNEVEESYEIEIDGENGAKNIVLVEKGCISVKEATCPDKICVKAGAITNGNLPITCLPNHLVIKIEEKGLENTDITSY